MNISIQHFYPVIWFCLFCNSIPLLYFYANRKINTLQCGNLNILLSDGTNIEGHYYLSQNVSDDSKGFIIIESVTKICKEHNLSVVETFDNIQSNLKSNDLLLKI